MLLPCCSCAPAQLSYHVCVEVVILHPLVLSGHSCLFHVLQAVKDKGYTLYSFDELMKLGAEKPAKPVPPKPDDISTIMYTSGTTGAYIVCVDICACVRVCVFF